MEDQNNYDMNFTKVRVRLHVEFEVDYIIDVKDPDNVDEIQEQLLDIGASRWESEPQFYERLGDDWYSFVRKVTKEHIEKVV